MVSHGIETFEGLGMVNILGGIDYRGLQSTIPVLMTMIATYCIHTLPLFARFSSCSCACILLCSPIFIEFCVPSSFRPAVPREPPSVHHGCPWQVQEAAGDLAAFLKEAKASEADDTALPRARWEIAAPWESIGKGTRAMARGHDLWRLIRNHPVPLRWIKFDWTDSQKCLSPGRWTVLVIR